MDRRPAYPGYSYPGYGYSGYSYPGYSYGNYGYPTYGVAARPAYRVARWRDRARLPLASRPCRIRAA
jgi:hypothetical protein